MNDFLVYNVYQHLGASVLLFILVLLEARSLKHTLQLTEESRPRIILCHSLLMLWLCLLFIPISSARDYYYHGHPYIGNLWQLRCLGSISLLISLWYAHPMPYRTLIALAAILGCIEGLGVYSFFLALCLLLYRQLALGLKFYQEKQQLKDRKEGIRKILLALEEQHKAEAAFDLHSSLHDSLGQRLGAIQQLLQEEKPDYYKLYPLLYSLISRLPLTPLQTSADNLAGLLKTYKTLGLEITLVGELPAQESLAQVFVQLISEAVNNALRHGNAKQIHITIGSGIYPEIKITNNGKISSSPLKLGKGLQSLQRLFARVGYTLTLEQAPQFTLKGRFKDHHD